jgi:hypothetical protein
MADQTVTVSRMLHYIMPGGEHRPAVVVKVNDDGTVNLQVFTDVSDQQNNIMWKGSVTQGAEVGQWHWAEAAPAPAEIPTQQ